MKIQALAVVAVMVLLPLTIVLNIYIDSQAKTLSYQVEYDNKLQNSTYDALKAFQLNTSNSDTSDIANSKIRDVKAGANSFFNSLATNFNMSGFDKESLSNFVPAVVFTMYDGYYIYSPYTNKLDNKNQNIDDETKHNLGSDADILNGSAHYQIVDENGNTVNYELPYYDNQKLSGLKPYVYYSCRYKTGSNTDVVITYSLDSYITIQGKANGNVIDVSGYLLSNVNSNGTRYRGININTETNYNERVFLSGEGFR